MIYTLRVVLERVINEDRSDGVRYIDNKQLDTFNDVAEAEDVLNSIYEWYTEGISKDTISKLRSMIDALDDRLKYVENIVIRDSN